MKWNGIDVVESKYCPKNKAYFIDPHTAVVKHIMYFYDHPKELFRLYDFDIAIKKYAEYVLDNLYTKIEKAFV